MANEWVLADVLRVMKQKANSEGRVDLLEVRRSFNIKQDKIARRFDTFVDYLVANGNVRRERNVITVVRDAL